MAEPPRFRFVGQPPKGAWGSIAFALTFVAAMAIAAVLGMLK